MNHDIDTLNDLHRKVYDFSAAEYDERGWGSKVSQNIITEAVGRVLQFCPPPARALDVGCAVGNITQTLADSGYTAEGIDISPKMIEIAKMRAPKLHFSVADVMQHKPELPYDLIVAFAFIHLFPSKEVPVVLAKLHNLLTEDGILYTGTTITDVFSEGYEEKSDYRGAPKRFRARWTREALDDEFEKAGFEIINVYKHADAVGKTWMDYVLRATNKRTEEV